MAHLETVPIHFPAEYHKKLDQQVLNCPGALQDEIYLGSVTQNLASVDGLSS